MIKVKTIKRIQISIINLFLCVFILCSCNSNIEDRITQTIKGYFSALESHEVDKIDSFLSDDLKIAHALNNEEERDAAQNHYFTIEDCELISIDFDKYEKTDKNIKVIVNYKVIYSKDYIPTGNRKIGENYLQEVFTLVESEGKYIIVNTNSDLLSP